jgi:hypothetical protein
MSDWLKRIGGSDAQIVGYSLALAVLVFAVYLVRRRVMAYYYAKNIQSLTATYNDRVTRGAHDYP